MSWYGDEKAPYSSPVPLNVYLEDEYRFIEPLQNGQFRFLEEYCISCETDRYSKYDDRCNVYNIKDFPNISVMEKVTTESKRRNERTYKFALFINGERITTFEFYNDRLAEINSRKNNNKRTAEDLRERNNTHYEIQNVYEDLPVSDVQLVYDELKKFRNETMWKMLQNLQESQDVQDSEESKES